MNRYIAKLVFNINIGNGENKTQFDEQTWLIKADSIETAFEKARLKGKEEEASWVNQNNKQVSWEFIDVSGLYILEDAEEEKAPIYSTTYENKDSDSFIHSVANKSMIIQSFFLTLA